MKRLMIGLVLAITLVGCGAPAPVQGYESDQGYMQPDHSESYYRNMYYACLMLCDPTPSYHVYVPPVGYPTYYRPWYPSPYYRPSSPVIVYHSAPPVYHVYQGQRGAQAPVQSNTTVNTTVRPTTTAPLTNRTTGVFSAPKPSANVPVQSTQRTGGSFSNPTPRPTQAQQVPNRPPSGSFSSPRSSSRR